MSSTVTEGITLKNTLVGHKGSINCLDVCNLESNLLASGSEDSSVRLWDLRHNRSSRCYMKCFKDQSIESVKFHPKDSNIVYVTSGNKVYTLDARVNEGAIIQREAQSILTFLDDDNEIDTMCIHPKGDYLAVGDDLGIVYIVPIDSSKTPVASTVGGVRIKALSGLHTNIIGSIDFKPKSARDIASGGFDCIVSCWDFSRGKPQNTHNYSSELQSALTSKSQSSTNIVNPPFVQALKYSSDGKYLYTGLGNGTINVHNGHDLKLIQSTEAHNAMTTAICVSDTIVISGGADKYVKAWQVIDTEVEETVQKGKKSIVTKVPSKDFKLIGEAYHGRSINAIAGNSSKSELLSSYFAVADTSNNISIYSFTN